MKPSAPKRALTSRDHALELFDSLLRGEGEAGPAGRLAFCVSTTDLDESKGDLFVALALARALHDAGWGITLWPESRYDEPMPAAIDIAVVLIESFVPGLLDRRTRAVAWVRNWTESWASLPYLQEFAAIWCSSEASADRIREVFDGEVIVVPISTDEDVFAPSTDTDREPGVVTTANFWGVNRDITGVLSALASSLPVTWYGRNGEYIEGLGSVEHRSQVPWKDLASVYSSFAIVIDDVIPAAAQYGNQNSRLFDALACGAMVVTNEARGLVELGLGDVPVYADENQLRMTCEALLADPAGTAERAARLRAVVLERHTSRARAASLAEHLDRLRPAPEAEVGPRDSLIAWSAHERESKRRLQHELDHTRMMLHNLSVTSERSVESIAALERRLDELVSERDSLQAALDAVTRSRAYRVARALGNLRRRIRLASWRS